MRLLSWLILIYLCCSAHELFLKTDAYHLQEGQQSELYLFNREPTASDFYFFDNATYLGWQAGATGTYVAGVSTRSRLIDLSADDFNDYLVHEGLTDMLSERQEQGIDDQPAANDGRHDPVDDSRVLQARCCREQRADALVGQIEVYAGYLDDIHPDQRQQSTHGHVGGQAEEKHGHQ